jgi:hypothetical protein
MPYAAKDTISTSPIDGGIEISDAQYQEALQAIAEGKRIRVQEGQLVALHLGTKTVYEASTGRSLEVLEDEAIPEGYSVTPPAEEEEKVTVVSMRQARLALLQVGLLPSVVGAVEQAGEAAKITWEYATEVRRDDALVAFLAQKLSLTEGTLDDLFTLANTL